MMVALEALKESVLYLRTDINEVVTKFSSMTSTISISKSDIFTSYDLLLADAASI